MSVDKSKKENKAFNPEPSIHRVKYSQPDPEEHSIMVSESAALTWSTRMDRLDIIRQGLPYGTIEYISDRTASSVKDILKLLGIPQTTYNKKKKDNDLLTGRDTEILLVLSELLDFGLDVFNNEKEKFQRWLKKPNISLGNVTPVSLFDSLTGIQEVRNSLNRLEHGNLA